MSDLALRLIEENKRTKSPFLDLGNCGLVNELPSQLLECRAWLTELNLGAWYSNENIETQSRSGESNFFDGTDLKILTLFPKLEKLHLSQTSIRDLNSISDIIHLKVLDLGYNGLVNITPLINLKQLRQLNIERNSIYNANVILNLKKLETLNIADSSIHNFEFLLDLRKLEFLNISSNKINDYTFLKKLSNLKELNLSSTNIKNYSFLTDYKELQSLDLNSNNISNADFLSSLLNLQYLNLGQNKITNVDFVRNLTRLQHLFLYDNFISSLIPLENLKNLRTLNLNDNKIKDIRSLKTLKNLDYLEIENNKLINIYALKNLNKLSSLSLRNNKIDKICSLQKLTSLKSLSFTNNKIQNITPILPLLLKGFEIQTNNNTYNLLENTIELSNNPISYPPLEIVRQGSESVINWYEEIQNQGEEIVYEAKLMIIGDAGSGKTSLSEKLKDINAPLPEKVDDTTVGIEISNIVFEAKNDRPLFKVNIWDLGGQKVYHPLHQLFFTQRSLYILVTDGRNDIEENDLIDFWIPAQELLGKESPMLILFNQHGSIQPNMSFRYFQSRYPNIKGDLAIVNLKSDTNAIQVFINEIESYIRNLPQFTNGEKLPKIWAKIRTVIDKKTENHITLHEFRSLCGIEGIKNIEKQDYVSDYMHDLGVILRFRGNPLLNKVVFLKPQWALDAIYKVLDHTRGNLNGHFTKSELQEIWSATEYFDIQDELLELMMKFELCYRIDSATEQYLVPSLLSKDIPPTFDWDKSNNICLHYTYDFMPKGIISRLVVRLHHLIDEKQLLWREGVILKFRGASAWVTRTAKNRIEIFARGYRPAFLISLITSEIDDINNKFYFSKEGKPSKYIPCICKACSNKDIPNFYEYDKLIERDKLNKKTVECSNPPYLEVNVRDLLDNITEIAEREEILNKQSEILSILRDLKIASQKNNDWQEALVKAIDEFGILQNGSEKETTTLFGKIKSTLIDLKESIEIVAIPVEVNEKFSKLGELLDSL